MAGLKSIDLAIMVAQKKRDLAGKKLVQLQQNLQYEQGQLDQLESYAADAQARWSASAQISMSPELLRHHYQFMDRLRQAISLQQNAIADMQAQMEAHRQQLIMAELALNNLQKLHQRKKTEISAALARREQKQTDEMASMQFGRAALRLH
jgi:flagellar FliJ protein